MKERVAALVEKLRSEHEVDIIRCAESGATPARIRMWQDLLNMGIIEMLPCRALDGWVLTELGKAVAREVIAARHARGK